jgi:hypothetical protein
MEYSDIAMRRECGWGWGDGVTGHLPACPDLPHRIFQERSCLISCPCTWPVYKYYLYWTLVAGQGGNCVESDHDLSSSAIVREDLDVKLIVQWFTQSSVQDKNENSAVAYSEIVVDYKSPYQDLRWLTDNQILTVSNQDKYYNLCQKFDWSGMPYCKWFLST